MSSAAPDYKKLYEKALLEAEQTRQLAQQKQQQAEALIGELTQKLALSLFELSRLRRKLFGQSSDNRSKYSDPNQTALFDLGISEQERQVSDEQAVEEFSQAKKDIEKADKPARKPREKNTRMELPADLPRQEVVIHPNGDLTNYVQVGPADKIVHLRSGQEVTEVLEITPPSFWVKRIIRTKWALKTADQTITNAALEFSSPGFLMATVPSRTITRGIFGDSLLAYLVIGKYIDHLPLYRQIKIFERLGVHLAASTVSDAIAGVCRLLEPLYNSLKREVLANKYLQADETTIRVQSGEKTGACHLGYLWAYHAPVAKLVLFDYQTGRGQEGPAKLLAEFGGVLQTDGYGVYSSLFDKNPTVTLAGCMAHVRRKFDEAVGYDAVRAKYVVAQIAKLYAIEKQIREKSELTELEICQLRLLEASPVLDKLKSYLLKESENVLPSSPIGKAMAYTLKLWDKLTVYLYHGQLQIDNNWVENTIRPIALGRKNYLFAGSHAAAQNAAMLYSFLGSCQRNNLNPHKWLSEVLTKLHDPEYEGKFSDLLPNH